MRAFLLLLAVFLHVPAAASESTQLKDARIYYEAMEFNKCVRRLEELPSAQSSSNELAELEIYQGLCRFALGRVDEAEDHFRIALRMRPDIELPPLTSPKVAARFRGIRDQVRAEPQTELRLTPDAPKAEAQEAHPLATQPPERQRSRVVPLALGGVGAASLGVASYFGIQARRLEGEANRATFDSDNYELGSNAKSSAVAANIALAVGVTAVGTAIVLWWRGDSP